jgi:prevent-host-death family protein
MLDLRDVFSLTDFLRNHKRHVTRLTQTGKPIVLTVKGKPALVLQSAEGYQDLLNLIDAATAKERNE